MQPTYKYLGNLGDASPVDHGGLFVYVDENGRAQAEYLDVDMDSDPDESVSLLLNDLVGLIADKFLESTGQRLDSDELVDIGERLESYFEDGEMFGHWTIYRFDLDKCTLTDGVLSDNQFHPLHPVWFAKSEQERSSRPQDTTYLSLISYQFGSEMTLEDLQQKFCSDDPLERAWAYREVGMYHGFDNLDSYPLTITCRKEVEARYKLELDSKL